MHDDRVTHKTNSTHRVGSRVVPAEINVCCVGRACAAAMRKVTLVSRMIIAFMCRFSLVGRAPAQ